MFCNAGPFPETWTERTPTAVKAQNIATGGSLAPGDMGLTV
jgi:hypothetical protein